MQKRLHGSQTCQRKCRLVRFSWKWMSSISVVQKDKWSCDQMRSWQRMNMKLNTMMILNEYDDEWIWHCFLRCIFPLPTSALWRRALTTREQRCSCNIIIHYHGEYYDHLIVIVTSIIMTMVITMMMTMTNLWFHGPAGGPPAKGGDGSQGEGASWQCPGDHLLIVSF